MKIKTIDNLIGWVGTGLVIGSYSLLSLGIFGNDWRYHLLVGLGSICLSWLAIKSKLWPVVALNAAFAFFACMALLRIWL